MLNFQEHFPHPLGDCAAYAQPRLRYFLACDPLPAAPLPIPRLGEVPLCSHSRHGQRHGGTTGPPLDPSRDFAIHFRDFATAQTSFGTTHPNTDRDHPTSDAAAMAAPSPRLVATAAATATQEGLNQTAREIYKKQKTTNRNNRMLELQRLRC